MKRLLNIRYIKLWNLFLSIGIDKNINSSINLEKMQHSEDIYKAVNKLLSVLKEGQLYSNEISQYMSNYFETTRKMTQNQKQLIKLVNQNYQSEKLKKIIAFKHSKDNKIDKNIEYNTNKFRINSTSIKNTMNENLSAFYKEEIEKNNQNNKIFSEKFLQDKENINKSLIEYNYKNIKTKRQKKYRSSSAGTATSTIPSNRIIIKVVIIIQHL